MVRAVTASRSLAYLATVLVMAVGVLLTATPRARADGPACALTSPASPSNPSAGSPCWTDTSPYPFGADGNSVDPNSPPPLCARPGPASGSAWEGDFGPNPDPGNPPCYLQVSSMAFRAWNRGLAATTVANGIPGQAGDTVAFGVWLYNGSNWFPDPTFPGSSVCPGSTVLWAGKLDYWLIGPDAASNTPETTVCRFDGVNLEWEPLSLPASTLARLPVNSLGKPFGGITSGACYAWNNCWFFGTDGISVHWDGQSLSDASNALGASPWLEGDFTSAVAGTDSSGNAFGFAVAKSTMTSGTGALVAVPAAPDGSPPTQLFSSHGGPWTPLNYAAPTNTTDLTTINADSQGDIWLAGDPAAGISALAPAPLERLSENGAAVCTDAFTHQSTVGYTWDALSTFPDGNALAAGQYVNQANQLPENHPDTEPAIVNAACGQTTVTEFRRPDPVADDQATAPLVPADYNTAATAVAANAPNDAWAATGGGTWTYFPNGNGGAEAGGPEAPHLYHWTDGLQPEAPAGNDDESRPSLFTIGPPVFVIGSPTIVVTPVVTTTTKTKGKRKKVKQKPAIYDTHTKLVHSPDGTYTLYLTFKVRRPVTIGLEALQGRKVVASTGLKHFKGHTGVLALRLDRAHWPTKLALETPKVGKKS